MTPTQAQIDAAAEQIYNDCFKRLGGEWKYLDINAVIKVQCQATAKAALTAAAEVAETGSPFDDEEFGCKDQRVAAAAAAESPMEHIARDIREGRFPQKSAPEDMAAIRNLAHAIERQDAKLTAAAEVNNLPKWHDPIGDAVAATIERCAQVAESLSYDEREPMASIIARHIRALKEKP